MPTHIRALVSWAVNSTLPRDAQMITPCFRAQSGFVSDSPDWDALAGDLATALDGWQVAPKRQLTVKLYEIGLPKPNRPKATVVKNVGVASAAGVPSELALCLSFNGGPNGPSNRGRLYLPVSVFYPTPPGARPATELMTKVGDLAPIFSSLGGANVDWIVWSPTKKAATRVERWFVDDEWDTQRKRGLRSTTRVAASTSG